MKVLNIDTFAAVKRQLVFKGKSHNVLETNVQQFIDNLKALEELEAADAAAGKASDKMSRQVENSVAAIHESIPTIAPEELKSLPIEALTAIMKFIRGELDLEMPAAEQAAVATEDAAAKKLD